MNRIYTIIILLTLYASCHSTGGGIALYVSTEGTATNDGSKQLPFARVEEAMEKAGQLKKNDPSVDIHINILPGDYYLSAPIKITPALSGLSIQGSGASEVNLHGAVPLTLDWEQFKTGIYVATVDAALDFDQLVVDGKLQILARYPNYDEGGKYWQGYAEDALSKERIASWENPEGAYFNALHDGRWGGFHFRITGVNDNGTAILEGGQQNNRGFEPHEVYRMVENVFEELDSPREWYLDKKNDKLYYWPLEGVDLNTSKFEVSQLKSLIQVVGTLEDPVKNIAISGITFKNTQRTFMEEFEPLLRSDWTIYRGAALFFEGTEDCMVEDSEFTYLGGNVIMASKYNKGLKVTGNHIHDCGASAVSFVGDPSAVRSPSFNYSEFVPVAAMDTVSGPKNDNYPRECLVADNLIHRIGRIEKQTAGVQISMAIDITVRHNSIYDVPRAGINIGDGTWGGHLLEYNDVFNTVLETSDHGSFNSWGRDRFWHPKRSVMDSLTTANPAMPTWDAIETTVIRNNRFRCDHGWDIDLDDGSSNYHIYNNLCLKNGIKLREGFNRTVENNIMVNNSLHPHVWFAKSGDVVKHNIMGAAYRDIRLQGWGKELDFNLFPTKAALIKAQSHERDIHSAYGDPQFKDPANLDFSVAEGSPALEIGFENFPMDEFGVMKPILKDIAKTPEVPEMEAPSDKDNAISPVVTWLRNDLKSVDSEQEQSAYGLQTPAGVVVLNVSNDSPAVKDNGLKKGDVILEAGGSKVKTVMDFFKITAEHDKSVKLVLIIMRNQAEKKISIRTEEVKINPLKTTKHETTP